MIDTVPRLTVLGGHYGVGKSECAVALALRLIGENPDRPVTLVDLDVVNPYFRSREARTTLEAAGITVIGNSLGIDTGVDLPAIPGSVAPALRDSSQRVIVDLGGDPGGARVLRQFSPSIPTEDTAFLFVFNRNRGENADLERARASLRSIEAMHGLPCAGIINNTHMLSETTCDHLRAGDEAARELASAVGVPVVYHAATADILARCADSYAGTPLTIGSVLRQGWMNTEKNQTNRR